MTNTERIILGIFFMLAFMVAGVLTITVYFPYEDIIEILKLSENFEWFGAKESTEGAMVLINLLILMCVLVFVFIPITFRIIGKQSLFDHIIISTRFKMDAEQLDPFDVIGNHFTFVSDENLVVTHRDRKNWIFFSAFLFIICFAGTFDQNFSFPSFVFSLVFFAGLLYGIFLPTKKIIFNRMDGTVTFTGSLFTKTIPFEKVEVDHMAYATRIMGLTHPVTRRFMSIPGVCGSESWSFYVWYMDKNRPLPNGTLLDPYREKDFKRRQAEGFPPPLYKAYCEITEETKELRKERTKNSD